MPLVHGLSHIKWHLPHSIYSEHRGRTPKCPIANHRVEYNYGKIIPVRLAIDKNNSLAECPIELEVLQEFPTSASSSAGGTREERITLGKLTLNLAEYVEESEAFVRDAGSRPRGPGTSTSWGGGGGNTATSSPKTQPKAHARNRSSLSATNTPLTASTDSPVTPKTSIDAARPPLAAENAPAQPEVYVEEGIIRRYLMAESKINSTLKIGILMVQLDGDRGYVAPPLKTAPVFGMGITGGSSSSGHADPGDPASAEFGQRFQDAHPEHDAASLSAQFSGAAGPGGGGSKARDLYELQDTYRRALAASWAASPGELAADECIEDIFQGGDGFGPDGDDAHAPGDATPRGHHGKGAHSLSRGKVRRGDSGSSTGGGGDEFLRPGDAGRHGGGVGGGRSRKKIHGRHGSGESGFAVRHEHGAGHGHGGHHGANRGASHRRDGSKDSDRSSLRGGMRSRSESLNSLANTVESERGRSGFKSAREVCEWMVRDDLVAWKLPGTAS